MSDIITLSRRDFVKMRTDTLAYRGALGYPVPGWHNGKLSDGTTPQCGMCDARAKQLSTVDNNEDTDWPPSWVHTGFTQWGPPTSRERG